MYGINVENVDYVYVEDVRYTKVPLIQSSIPFLQYSIRSTIHIITLLYFISLVHLPKYIHSQIKSIFYYTDFTVYSYATLAVILHYIRGFSCIYLWSFTYFSSLIS